MTNARDRAEAAASLRALLEQIAAGTISASSGQLRRLEGAVLALEATAPDGVRGGDSKTD